MPECQFTPGCNRDGIYRYSDPVNGKLDFVSVCKECLYNYVCKHYPGGAVQRHLEDNYPELKELEEAQA